MAGSGMAGSCMAGGRVALGLRAPARRTRTGAPTTTGCIVTDALPTLVRVTVADGVRTITLDSQHNRNALSSTLVSQVLHAVAGAEDDDASKVIVLQAEGPAFCSGADLKEMAAGGDEGRAAGTRGMLAVLRAIAASPCPVVARVHAPVRAGGIGMVAACDVVVASTDATFALTEVRLGLAPAIISLTVAPRMHDRSRSLTWLTGQTFDGAAAVAHGLATMSCAPDALDDTVAGVVAQLTKSPKQGLAETKKLLSAAMVADIDARGEELAALSSSLFGSDVARESMMAFLNRGKS
jgi:methylglutaconyl-CoA hydratase